MENVIKIFHYISFIKYPILVIGIYCMYKPSFSEDINPLKYYNYGYILVGIGMGLDTLKDNGKLTWLDKRVYHNPKIVKYFFINYGLLIICIIGLGVFSYFSATKDSMYELVIGFIIFGIGSLGILKAGIQATKYYLKTRGEP